MNYPKDMRTTLKNAREMVGLTQAEAAKRLEITEDTLRSYEKGRSFPDIPMLRKIESLYGVTYNQIIFLPLDFGLTEA